MKLKYRKLPSPRVCVWQCGGMQGKPNWEGCKKPCWGKFFGGFGEPDMWFKVIHLPGVKKDEAKVTVEGQTLTLKSPRRGKKSEGEVTK